VLLSAVICFAPSGCGGIVGCDYSNLCLSFASKGEVRPSPQADGVFSSINYSRCPIIANDFCFAPRFDIVKGNLLEISLLDTWSFAMCGH
jgi:hypothetical protein